MNERPFQRLQIETEEQNSASRSDISEGASIIKTYLSIILIA